MPQWKHFYDTIQLTLQVLQLTMNSFGAIILAGGRSSRMGRDKAGLVLGGQTLLERLIRTVSPLVGRMIVMMSASQKIPQLPAEVLNGVEIGRDTRPAEGPLQGISDALPLLNNEIAHLFVLSCDLPYLTTEILRSMTRLLTPDVDGVCAETKGCVNPLLAVYHRRLLEQAVRPVAAGRSCMVLVDDHPIVRVSPPAENRMAFDDINTPSAYEIAKAALV